MIKIDKIEWLSEEAREAEVYISDENFDIICFACPLDQDMGDEVPLPLYTLHAEHIYLLKDEDVFSVEKEGTGFSYSLSGCVIDKENNQIKVGEFILELDSPLPGDIGIGDYVSFVCARIDIC